MSFSKMSMKFGKKGSLQLSINAIVILILAITMLGLGLGFMKNLFSKTTSQLAEVGEDIQSQVIEELEKSRQKLSVDKVRFTMERSDEKDVFYGIKNLQGDVATFGVNAECLGNLNGDDASAINGNMIEFKLDDSIFNGMEDRAVEVAPLKVIIGATAEVTTYTCKLTVDAGGDFYAKQNIFITVE